MEISLNLVVVGIVSGSLVFVALAAVFSRLHRSSSENQLKKLRITCRLCGMIFAAENEAALVRCQHCGKLNLHKHNGQLG